MRTLPGRYIPILELRPAEMLALEQLPNKDKDLLLPLFRLRPWATANALEKSVERLSKAFGKRSAFLGISDPEFVEPEKRRPVHGELHALRSHENGYKNWFEYLQSEKCAHFIPLVQIGPSAEQFGTQIEKLHSLGRGLLIHLEAPPRETIAALVGAIGSRTSNGAAVTVVLDYGKQDSNFQLLESSIREALIDIRRHCAFARVAISSSSFPESFTGIERQPIYERVLFDRLVKDFPDLIYSDRGSARAEKQLGGGGLPAPRIDYPTKTEWFFFRESGNSGTQFDGYQTQALRLMRSELWEEQLRLWGAQMIERTAAGDSQGGISSPNRSTAARINLHLHRQLYYSDDASFFDTDEEWSD